MPFLAIFRRFKRKKYFLRQGDGEKQSFMYKNKKVLLSREGFTTYMISPVDPITYPHT